MLSILTSPSLFWVTRQALPIVATLVDCFRSNTESLAFRCHLLIVLVKTVRPRCTGWGLPERCAVRLQVILIGINISPQLLLDLVVGFNILYLQILFTTID